MQKRSKKNSKKRRGKKRKADERAARSAENANAKRVRKNESRKQLRLLSQSSTSNNDAETYTTSVASPSDGNSNVTSAPPTNALIQNEGA